jgi:DNA gyrase subunit A
VLASERKLLAVVKEELVGLKKPYGDDRRTEIVGEIQELKIEDLIADEDMVLMITHAGYIKRLPVSAYRRQKRGGMGVTGMETKEEDFVEHLFIASTHEYLLFFTTSGKAYWLKVHEVPQASRYAKGTAIVNVLALEKDDRLSSFVAVKAFEADKFLVLTTRLGNIKKTSLEAFSKRELLLLTRHGKAIRFPESQVREMGRGAGGVRGIRLDKDDHVVGVELVDKGATLLTVTSLGFGKRTPADDYRLQSRGGKGIINIKSTKKNGEVVGTKTVDDQDDVMLLTREGMVVRCRAKDIRATGRNAQGVRIMKLQGKDEIASVASLAHEDGDDAEPAPADQSN